ncbi:MAG: transposase [Planctomycetota bacterium]
MVSCARRRLLGEDGARTGTFHCTTRCVRRAFLCGEDPLTGQDYSYRRDWIMLREEQLAGLFTIDIEFRRKREQTL